MKYYKLYPMKTMCIKDEITEEQFNDYINKVKRKTKGNISWVDIGSVTVYVIPPLNTAILAKISE